MLLNQQTEIRQLLIDYVVAEGTVDPAVFAENNWQLVRSGAPVFEYVIFQSHPATARSPIMTSAFSSLALDAVDVRRTADFWIRALDYRVAEEEDGIISLAPVDGSGPPLDIVPVPERKTVKNRLHLDLHAVGCTQEEEVERLLALGAVRADIGQGPDVSWTVLADPEGNEFCILAGSSGAAS